MQIGAAQGRRQERILASGYYGQLRLFLALAVAAKLSIPLIPCLHSRLIAALPLAPARYPVYLATAAARPFRFPAGSRTDIRPYCASRPLPQPDVDLTISRDVWRLFSAIAFITRAARDPFHAWVSDPRSLRSAARLLLGRRHWSGHTFADYARSSRRCRFPRRNLLSIR